MSQQSKEETHQLDIAVDPDVMEFVTTSTFRDQLNNSLAAKKSEIVWKPNNKMAVIVYRGEDKDSWQTECIDEVQNYLGKFAKCDVQINKDFWDAVVVQLSSIRTSLGVNPLLVKFIDDSSVARIVSLSSDMKDYEKKFKSKLEEIYREETRKSYLKRKVPNVPEERYVTRFRDDVMEVMKKPNTFLETNRIRDERFVCSSQIVRKYLAELRQEDLRSIENQLKASF